VFLTYLPLYILHNITPIEGGGERGRGALLASGIRPRKGGLYINIIGKAVELPEMKKRIIQALVKHL